MSCLKLDLHSRKLSEIPVERVTKKPFSEINLSNNPLKTLKNLPELPELRKLNLDRTEIETFVYAAPQPNIQKISFRKSPLAEFQYCRMMATIVFGDSLGFINGKPLSSQEIKFRNQYSRVLRNYFVSGYVLDQIKPIRLHSPYTGAEQVIHSSDILNFKHMKIEDDLIESISKHTYSPTRRCLTDTTYILMKHKQRLSDFQSTITPKRLNFGSESDDDTIASINMRNDDSDETSEEIAKLGKLEQEVTEELFEDGFMSGSDHAYCYPQPNDEANV